MDLNSVIFPAPQSSFDFRQITEVIWIPKKDTKNLPNTLDLTTFNTSNNEENEKTNEPAKKPSGNSSIDILLKLSLVSSAIPCLYLPYKYGSDKVLIYFHGNAEDIGWALEFCQALKEHFQVLIIHTYINKSFRSM